MDIGYVDEPQLPSAGFVRMPGFPDILRDVVPRADGQLGPRDETHYGPQWMQEERRRQILTDTDLLYNFASRVAAETNDNVSTYWRVDTDHKSLADMMITNAISRMGADGALSADAERIAREDRLRAFQKADSTAMREHLERVLLPEAPSRFGRRPSDQEEIRRIIEASERRVDGRPQAPRAPAPAGVLPPALPPGAPNQPSPLSSTGSLPPVGRPQGPQPRAQVLSQRAMEAGEAGQPLRTTDASGAFVYNIEDGNVMLLRLMLSNPSESALKAWKMLYGPGSTTGVLTNAMEARYWEDVAKMEKLLQRGHGDLPWVSAPQHTGYIFFSPKFASGVAAATAEVQSLCGKPEATELALMTHSGVVDLFVKLVAYHIRSARMSFAARWGGTRQTLDAHRDMHARLISAFRRLRMDTNGFLYVPRTAKQGAAPEPADSGRNKRRAYEQYERRVMAETGRYNSDLY